jgi:putative membrane protein
MEFTEVLIGAIIGILIAAVISGVLIWLVGKLNVGLTVKNFGWAMIAGLLIGFLTHIVMLFMPDFGAAGGFLVNLVVSAGVILASGKMLSGLTVDGFKGALFAAMAIAAIGYLATFLLA